MMWSLTRLSLRPGESDNAHFVSDCLDCLAHLVPRDIELRRSSNLFPARSLGVDVELPITVFRDRETHPNHPLSGLELEDYRSLPVG